MRKGRHGKYSTWTRDALDRAVVAHQQFLAGPSGDADRRARTHATLRRLQMEIDRRILAARQASSESKKGLIDLGWFGSLDDPIPPKPPTR